MLPSGRAHLVIALHDVPIQWACARAAGDWRSWKRGVLHGPQTKYFLAAPKPKGTVVGVSFRPGMAGAILGIPLVELRDGHVSLDELWGGRGCGLRDRLWAEPNAPGIFRLLERELISRMAHSWRLHPAVAYALAAGPPHSDRRRISDIQSRTGYSPRHFIDVFRSAVGLGPKQYFRIRRFSSALIGLARGDAKLSEVALATGYADQAHLAREFRELAGTPPSCYRPRSELSAHHHRP